MSSDNVYIKKFEELLQVEEKARDFYKYYINQLKDTNLLEKFKEIYQDEIRHVNISKNIIKMAFE
tara:strand:- start:264 stop:458 length:195 start_codon:yes stop_codon:yes gene_type:complete